MRVVVSDLDRIERIDDLDTAKEWAKLYVRENARLKRKLEELITKLADATGQDAAQQIRMELAKIQEQLGTLQHKMFGESSERRPNPEAKPTEEKKPQKGHGPREQPGLRREQQRLEIPEAERTCFACGGPLEEMKDQAETTEQITSRAREYLVQVLVAQKYRCRCGMGVRTAPKPLSHIKGGRYSMDFAIDVAIDKYLNHLPLDRQRRMMARAGLVIDTQTLWDQIDGLARHLERTYWALHGYILGADVVGADETWWRLMQAEGSKRWWAWSLTVPDAVWHGIAPSRSAATAKKYLEGFEGTLLVDGYKAYDTIAKEVGGIKLAHCWAHVRRKFFDAEKHYPACGSALDMIGELFELDRGTPDPAELDGDARADAEQRRLSARREHGPPILERLRTWSLEQRGLPKSALRQAIDYMHSYWKGLTAFLDDPHVPLDNNRTERALRGLVIGRKNHYGSRSQRGTEVAAIFYSVLETAILNEIDPRTFLEYAAKKSILTGEAAMPWRQAT